MARVGAAITLVDRGATPHPPAEIDEIDREVVDGKEQEADARK